MNNWQEAEGRDIGQRHRAEEQAEGSGRFFWRCCHARWCCRRMNNWLPRNPVADWKEVYDLKGSADDKTMVYRSKTVRAAAV